jgi:hypothetical protein
MPPSSAFRHPVSLSGARSIPVQDWVPLFQYRTGSGIGIFVHSGTRLTGCRTVHPVHVHIAGVGGGERDTQCPDCK